ncbi:DinB family protein [Lacibacter sp. H407]|uniref:DinB family protein n=1 Tax=Lacibacter sp. H407 TaxID=3133423 RepID=UPI0030BB3D02
MNNKEVQSIISNLQRVINGQPWYGEAVLPMLQKIHPAVVYINPKNSHAAIEILYHMINWAQFTLNRLQRKQEEELMDSEESDWRTIDPKEHTWKKGLAEFESLHQQIVANLQKRDDSFLDESVDFRDYNFRFLLNGLIQHNIYHLGQIAFLKNLLGE